LRSDANARLAALYDELLPVVYGYVRSRLAEADAEDVTAEVFRTAAEQLQRDPTAQLTRSWFLTAARNRVIDRWRHQMRWEGRLEALRRDVDVQSVAPGTGTGEAEDRVLDALDRLSPDHRAVLILRYVDGLRTRAIAEALGRNPRATDSLLARARRELVAAFEEVAL
jgi:RNA polymerase sigma-70 factor (ECF subfamily)